MDFHDLYTRYAADVHRFSMYLACNRALADDITSETFPRAWSSAAPIREATVKAYLFAIARNVYLQELRRTSRHDELDDSIPSTSPRQDTRVEQRAALGVVLRALRGFSAVDLLLGCCRRLWGRVLLPRPPGKDTTGLKEVRS
jgi:DNA-directed RNA polymerase specialized sigma24 family protein